MNMQKGKPKKREVKPPPFCNTLCNNHHYHHLPWLTNFPTQIFVYKIDRKIVFRDCLAFYSHSGDKSL
jgi:hypothetical protein